MKFLNYVPAALLFLLISSCDSGNNNEGPPKDSIPSIPKDTFNLDTTNQRENASYEDEQVKLGLTAAEEKKIMPELGLTYKELQKSLPELKTSVENNEKPNTKNMTKSTARIVMLNKTIEAEFQFRNDSLIKCSYLVNELDYNQADKFYKGLQSFYSSRLGECNETKVEEENHYNRSCNWAGKDYKAELNFDINKSLITWGMETK
jgi:hypothetical protein